MLKLQITYNKNGNQETAEINNLSRCERLSKKPDDKQYILQSEERKELLKMYNNNLKKVEKEENKKRIQELIQNIDSPRIISGIHTVIGENPNQYYEIEFANGKTQILAVDGTVKLVEIPVQETEIEIIEKVI